MSPSPPADHDRLLELLADRTLVGLDAGEQQELESLLQANPISTRNVWTAPPPCWTGRPRPATRNLCRSN